MKRLTSICIVIVLVSFSGASVYARTTSDSSSSPKVSESAAKPGHSTGEAKASEKLKADVMKLVADAKAGKLKSPPPQFPARTKRNNLSKGAKIAIVAGIGALIFGIIAWRALHDDSN